MKLKRAYSPGEVLNMKIPRYEFTGDWQASIGNPAKSGVWIIWGASGNGKSSFVMQLAKYLCGFGRVIYDSLEESTGLSFQMSLKRLRWMRCASGWLSLTASRWISWRNVCSAGAVPAL